jgi:hypothetical protein
MKIILSRKGFDSANGGCPSPILPDGTLLSMPIPSDDSVCYEELYYNDNKYSDLLQQLNPRKAYSKCHLDPDIRKNNRLVGIPEWKPAFGQTGSSQGLLMNAQVGVGDVFLFFGWFKQVELYNGKYRYVRKNAADFYHSSDLHIIFGYMQIGEIITNPQRIADYHWHPHSSHEHLKTANNTLYIPSERLSFLPDYNGYGVLDYREDRVLTMKDQNRGTWKELDFLFPEHVYGNKKNSAKEKGLYYSGIWQELVVFESENLLEWVKGVIE